MHIIRYAIRLKFFLLLNIAGFIAYQSLYHDFISVEYGYYGFQFRSLDVLQHMIVFIYLSAPLLFINLSLSRPSDYAILIMYVFIHIPISYGAFFFDEDSAGLFLTLLSFFGLYITSLSRKVTQKIKIIHVKLDRRFIGCGLSLGLAIFLGYLVWMPGGGLSVDITTAYERRDLARETGGQILGYLIAQVRAAVYVFGAYFIVKFRSAAAGIACIVLALAGFAFDGTKTSLVIPIALVLVVCHAARGGDVLWILLGCLSIIFLGVIEFYAFNSDVIVERLVRRAFAIPGYISAAYYDFFSQNDKVLFTDSFGRYLLQPRYLMQAPYLIGDLYLSNPEINANTNIFMGGYANLGLWGVVVTAFVAGSILGLTDQLTDRGWRLLGVSAAVFLALKWSEQMLHTSLLSGGVFFLLISIYILRNPVIGRVE